MGWMLDVLCNRTRDKTLVNKEHESLYDNTN